jgi:two-component system KDP operon response regulator KdpE
MGTPAHILIIDDDPLVAQTIMAILGSTTYEIHTAISGKQALEVLQYTHYDLLLLDLELGDMHGVTLLQQIRASYAEVEIIIITAHASLQTVREALRYGVADYILKPVSSAALREVVERLVARAQAATQRTLRLRELSSEVQQWLGEAGARSIREVREGALYDKRRVVGSLVLDLQHQQAWFANQMIDLTQTEFRLLVALTDQPGATISCAALSVAINRPCTNEVQARKIIRPHISRLRQKIESYATLAVFIELVRGIGYRWNQDG